MKIYYFNINQIFEIPPNYGQNLMRSFNLLVVVFLNSQVRVGKCGQSCKS